MISQLYTRTNTVYVFSVSNPPDGSMIAKIHSHPNDPDHENELFSTADITVARNLQCLSYISTPNGYLKKYDPKVHSRSDRHGTYVGWYK